jgi:hypothetical protein
MQFPSQNRRFLCNRPDGPLKVSGCPAMSRSFSVEDVRTSEKHRSNARSNYSESGCCFRHGSGNSNRLDGRATPSGRFSGFQEDFCTRLSVFIITLRLSIGLRRNWCRKKAKKKSYNFNVLIINRNVRTAHLPNGKRVASGRLPEIREISEFLFKHGNS